MTVASDESLNVTSTTLADIGASSATHWPFVLRFLGSFNWVAANIEKLRRFASLSDGAVTSMVAVAVRVYRGIELGDFLDGLGKESSNRWGL
jgi:hypothetical protein